MKTTPNSIDYPAKAGNYAVRSCSSEEQAIRIQAKVTRKKGDRSFYVFRNDFIVGCACPNRDTKRYCQDILDTTC